MERRGTQLIGYENSYSGALMDAIYCGTNGKAWKESRFTMYEPKLYVLGRRSYRGVCAERRHSQAMLAMDVIFHF